MKGKMWLISALAYGREPIFSLCSNAGPTFFQDIVNRNDTPVGADLSRPPPIYRPRCPSRLAASPQQTLHTSLNT